MESKKIKWNKILNYMIAGVGLVLASLFIGLCFVTPTANIKANALTMDDIKNYNIAFTAAKTKIRKADGYKLVTKTDKNNSSSTEFDGYSYNYIDPAVLSDKSFSNPYDLYYLDDTYTTGKNNISLSLKNDIDNKYSNFSLYKKYQQTVSPGFIPAGAKYYKNAQGNLEEIFYDNAENNDFVVLNNYNTPTNATFNVENFYLSFGTPYIDETDKESTPLLSLSVQAYLYTTDGREHDLLLNVPDGTYLDEAQTKINEYWYQYFDLTQLKAKISPDSDASEEQTYDINGLEGKYVFTFSFNKYDKNLNASDDENSKSIFQYTFYLLDGNNYLEYPTISNAEIGLMDTDKTSEYFYNFQNTNIPNIEYNPSRFNISYTRENKEITENITSKFEVLTYKTSETPSRNLDLGLISFYNNNILKKEVYIVSFYNNSKTQIEYLYLANNSKTSLKSKVSTWVDILSLIDSDELTFEYKTAQTISIVNTTVDTTTYTITNYETTDFKNCTIGKIANLGDVKSTETIIKNTNKYYLESIDNTNLIYDNSTNTTGSKANTKLLNKIIDKNIDKLSLNYLYKINFNELGIYNFDYNYVLPNIINLNVSKNIDFVINSTEMLTNNMISSYSDNITKPIDFAINNKVTTTNKTPTPTTAYDLVLTLSGVIETDTSDSKEKTTILGNTYTINNSNTITDGVSTITLKSDSTFKIANKEYPAVYEIKESSEQRVLIITITLDANYKINTETRTDEYFKNDGTDKKYYEEIIEVISDSIVSDTFDTNNISPEQVNVKEMLLDIISMPSVKVVTKNKPTTATDKLHVFGSIAYFDREDSSTDSGYAKLQYNDIKANKKYTSDITNTTKLSNTNTNGFTSTILEFAEKHNSDPNNRQYKITYDNLVVTDYLAVLWKNLSTMAYQKGSSAPVAKSVIYRYNYFVDDQGNFIVDYGNYTELKFNKDVPVQGDGYYEVVLKYTYDYYKQDNSRNASKEFTQTFAFIIDQSSPKLDIKVVNEDSTLSPLPTNRFTNKDISISWATPTYFKNDVFIDIQKYDFNNEHEFTATYKKNNITSNSSDNIDYVKSITTTKNSSLDTYKVDIVNPGKTSTYSTSGKYTITIHYGIGNTTSQKFIIDTQDISGMQVIPVITSNNTLDNSQLDFSSKIINVPFTFRYNAKASGAKITTKYYQIMFNANSDPIQLLTKQNFNKNAITTNFKIAGNNSQIELDSQYIFEPTNSKEVSKANIFPRENTTSCIYLFELEDEAGNTCRYVVMYDTTAPKFLTLPEPTNKNNIINDTTRIIYGDYKAIELETPANFQLIATTVDNYSKNATDTLSTAISYMKSSSSAFDNIKIEQFGSKYYLLLPLNQIELKDVDNNQNITTYTDKNQKTFTLDTSTSEFYFFPNNPVTGNNIELPIYNENTGAPQYENGALKKNNYELVSTPTIIQYTNNANDTFERFILATYYPDNNNKTITKTIKGIIGQGKFQYTIYDARRNYTNKIVWMNLDKTQTLAYGLFNYTGDIASRVPLTGSIGTYSAAQIFISSLQETGTKGAAGYIPDYEVTYKYFGYNAELYNKEVTALAIVNDNTDSDITYLQITFKGQANPYKLQLTDEEGNKYPAHSYPYDIQGNAIIADSHSNPTDIYANKLSYVDTNEPNRIFSRALNLETDKEVGKTVTKEGLYIVKRKYADGITQSDLGLDSRIIYLVYYVDRAGIISIATNSTTANGLYNISSDIGKDIGFTLGHGTQYEKDFNANTIYNNQIIQTNTNLSNKSYSYNNMFDTNKTDIEFTLTADKYRYENFASNKSSYISIANNNDAIEDAIENYLFNSRFNNQYKLNLSLSIGNINNGQIIIDENNIDSTKHFNDKNINTYLNTDKQQAEINNKRSNVFYMYVGDTRDYTITLKDTAGYDFEDTDGNIISNYACNTLTMTFRINHYAPTGDAYGKYYDNQSNYDESTPNNPESLPMVTNPETKDKIYNLLYEYLNPEKTGGTKLNPLSNSNKQVTNSPNGTTIELYNTNNETLIFVFAITNNDTQAKIDTGNIQVYKGGQSANNLIFNRVNGKNESTPLVTDKRQVSSFICNNIGSIDYYAIIVFDNNLDEILNSNESDYSNFRLLDKENNPDSETYYLNLHYVGDKNNYVNGETGDKFDNTVYKIVVDRVKPIYNLTKLMSLDKYVYNNEKQATTTTNYNQLFETYKKYYNFKLDSENPTLEFERSDIENYFFAVDYRKDSSFTFENISDLESDNSIYFRKVSGSNYKFSITPDDYRAYQSGIYSALGHPKFIPSNAIDINSLSLDNYKNGSSIVDNQYYRINYNIQSDSKLSINWLLNAGLFAYDSYYEILERDEAGNYRVYAIYVPDLTKNEIDFSYKYNANVNSLTSFKIDNTTYPLQTISGMDFRLNQYKTQDMYLKAQIDVKSSKYNSSVIVIFDPRTSKIYLKTTNNTVQEEIDVEFTNPTDNSIRDTFISTINELIAGYHTILSNPSGQYYTDYGYVVDITMFDRIGIRHSTFKNLLDYSITYNVAGSELKPSFNNNGTTSFTITLPAKKGSTSIVSLQVYRFNSDWKQIDSDATGEPFYKTLAQYEDENKFILTKGVYRFRIRDNFNRETDHYYEFGISATQAGGSILFTNPNSQIKHSNGYTYTSNEFKYTFDSSVYNVYIRFIGNTVDEIDGVTKEVYDETTPTGIFYKSGNTYSEAYLQKFGIIKPITTANNITTITFSGVNALSKYHIKTIMASTAANSQYEWNAESSNKNLLVYNNQIALYTLIPNVTIRNLNGVTLSTDTHLNLTEDFELALAWPNNDLAESERYDFNSRISLTRTVNNNGHITTNTFIVNNGYIVKEPGEYSAYVINDLNNTSARITFTRGVGEISMYAVYKVDTSNYINDKLEASSYTMRHPNDSKMIFTYFTTTKHFNLLNDTNVLSLIEIDPKFNGDLTKIKFNTDKPYIDVRVNSNLNILTEINEIATEHGTPYIQYEIYSIDSNEVRYTYRYIRIYFVDSSITQLSNIEVTSSSDVTLNLMNANSSNATIKSTDREIFVNINFGTSNTPLIPIGDNITVERYYNNELVETYYLDIINIDNLPTLSFKLKNVGLHQFVIKDLAGRTHTFFESSKAKNNLSIYQINQILFTVNDEEPINNQIFNKEVKINIQTILSDLSLYDAQPIGYIIYKNGEEIQLPTSGGEILFTEPGYYTVKMNATSSINSQEITATYNFVIINDKVASRSFNISKGTGFTVSEVWKIINGERTQIHPDKLINSNSLLWLTHSEQGNSMFEITLSYYDENKHQNREFSFNVWINEEQPVILSSIPAGTATKETINLNYNPGLIYQQIGKCYIKVNGTTLVTIDSDSNSIVETISINQKGEYWVQVVQEDGTIISSYKFTKNEPLTGTTKVILICAGIGVVVLVVLFLLIRKKGKYR